MKRILLTCLWLAVIVFVAQVAYFVFFSTSGPKFNEGRPLSSQGIDVPVQNISSLYRNGDTVWIGTNGHGLSRYSIQDGKTVYVTGSEILEGKNLRCMAMDKQGRLWIGTARDGLFIGSNKEWKQYNIAQKVADIKVAPDGEIIVAHDTGLVRYDPETNTWSPLEIQSEASKDLIEPTALAFDSEGKLFVATSCTGLIRLDKNESGIFVQAKHITTQRRFGPGSTPNVAPVPLDPCGEHLPSNQINDVVVTNDNTVWAATSAGLAWSRDSGETWHFLRGRDYGDKMRGLIAGTPYKWKELPRVRFGELLPEDNVTQIHKDENGTLWIVTNTLGCVAVKPNAFYQEMPPKNDDPDSAQEFLTAMAENSSRFHGTKTDRIISMTPMPDGKMLLASGTGKLEILLSPPEFQDSTLSVAENTAWSDAALPADYAATKTEQTPVTEWTYPQAVFTGSDYVTAETEDKNKNYGKTYTLLGGGNFPHDKLVAEDESACKVRLFVGNVGNRTRPLERTVIVRSAHSHDHDHAHEHGHEENATPGQTAWSSVGNTVPKTYDGQHLWLEVDLKQPGHHRLSLYFVDPDEQRAKREKSALPPRDHLIEIFPEPKIRIPKTDWLDLGKRLDLLATEQTPLAKARVTDFAYGVYKNVDLAGPGTYFVKIDKNYSRRIDLCSVHVDLVDSDAKNDSMPEKTEAQAPDMIP